MYWKIKWEEWLSGHQGNSTDWDIIDLTDLWCHQLLSVTLAFNLHTETDAAHWHQYNSGPCTTPCVTPLLPALLSTVLQYWLSPDLLRDNIIKLTAQHGDLPQEQILKAVLTLLRPLMSFDTLLMHTGTPRCEVQTSWRTALSYLGQLPAWNMIFFCSRSSSYQIKLMINSCQASFITQCHNLEGQSEPAKANYTIKFSVISFVLLPPSATDRWAQLSHSVNKRTEGALQDKSHSRCSPLMWSVKDTICQ